MKKKIIYLSSIDLTLFNAEAFGFNFLRTKKLDLEYWYAHFLYSIKKKPKDIIKKKFKKTFFSLYELESTLKKESKNFNLVVVLLLNLDYQTVEIYRIIKKYNIKTVSFLWDLDLEVQGYKKNLIEKLVEKFFYKLNYNHFLIQILAFIKILLYKKFKLIKDSEIIFFTGLLARNILIKKKVKSKLISLNTNDCDKLLKIKNQKRIIKKKYCVFLDSAMTSYDHIDKYIFNEKDMAGQHKTYFQSLNNFFKIIEDKYKIKVVVSRHPKNKLNLKKFLKRRVYDYKSAELVKDSEFVICHQSLSMNYAILLCKPIFFIYTEQMLNRSTATNKLVKLIKLYGSKLNQPVFNIDKKFELLNMRSLIIDRYKYTKYKKEYLSLNSEKNFYSKEVILNNLKKL